MIPPDSAPPTRGLFTFTSPAGSIPERWVPSTQWLGGCVGDSGGWFMNNVLSLELARERARQPRRGWNGHALRLGLPPWNSEATGPDERSTGTQRFLERLEAENAQLRGSVVELALQIQELRDRVGTLTA
jgi:hypothetical protein